MPSTARAELLGAIVADEATAVRLVRAARQLSRIRVPEERLVPSSRKLSSCCANTEPINPAVEARRYHAIA